MRDYEWNGKTVLVTGGSMGIGEVFARELDKRGAKLVLVARSAGKLEALAKQLQSAQWIAEDLGAAGAASRVFAEVSRRKLEIDVVINNAGFGVHGEFADIARETQREMIDLNVGTLVELTHLFLPMIERNQGGVILVASTAAYQPVPRMAVYGATKAFVLSFGEALWAEYRQRGVRVQVLSPGATETPFFARAGEQAAIGTKAKPEAVVALGLAAFSRNTRPSVVHGAKNAIMAASPRFVTRALTAKIAAKITAPKKQLAAPARGATR
ncbi:MAG: SDR family oxidoreductase [Kofleriaceae bacterium]